MAARTVREPVLTRAGVVTAIAILAAVLVKVGAGHVSQWLVNNSDWIAGVILAVGPVVAGLLARAHVTPLVAPIDALGRALVPLVPMLMDPPAAPLNLEPVAAPPAPTA